MVNDAFISSNSGMQMKISIIIPVYNVEPYIERCLQSVMNQTYQGFIECIIIDDCGSDNSMDVVNKMLSSYMGNIQFKVLKHEHNRGLSAARNTGMKEATGNYIFFLDSDDELPVDSIEVLSSPLQEELYDIIVGNIKTIGDDEIDRGLSLKLSDKTILRDEQIQETYRKEWNMIVPSKLYRMEFIRQQQLQFKEGMIHEDELWSLQVSCVAKSLRAVNKICYRYFVKEGSITTSLSNDLRKAEMLRLVVTEMCDFINNRGVLSQPTYRLLLHFMTRSLKPYKYNRKLFFQKFVQLQNDVQLPLKYRFRAAGMDVRLQIKSILFVLPPIVSAHLLYLKFKRQVSNNTPLRKHNILKAK